MGVRVQVQRVSDGVRVAAAVEEHGAGQYMLSWTVPAAGLYEVRRAHEHVCF